MISVLALLGKIAEFIANGLQQERLTRASDKRGQACASISRLYYLLVELRELTNYMEGFAQDAVDRLRPEIIGFVFRCTNRRIARLTNDFVETFTLLQNTLEIFAPDVAAALCSVSYSKSNILWETTQFVIIDGDERSCVRKIRFLEPDARLLNIDIGSFAERLRTGEAEARAERFEWPDPLLYYGSTKDGFESKELAFAEISDAQHFATLLRDHGLVLSKGIEILRKFISENFTIDEVLYEHVEIEPDRFC